MKIFINQIVILSFFLLSIPLSAQYFSEESNEFNIDTKIPNVSNWCPEAGVYYLPGQEIYLNYTIYENNLTTVELGFSSEENGAVQVLQTLPPTGPVNVTIPNVPTTFARLYIIAKDSYGHVNNYPIPWEGYFNIGAATQTLFIPQGWSGISLAYVPVNNDLSSMFADYMGNISVIQDLQNIFWPGGGVFTLNEWDVFQGYFIHANTTFTAQIEGSSTACDQWGYIPEGWGLIPIIAECDLDAENFFWWNLWSSQIIKEAAGWRVFWPEYNVKTLEVLERGKSYLVYSTMANNDFIYQPCWEEESARAISHAHTPESWNEPVCTPNSHIIVIPENVVAGSGFDETAIIGVFNNAGLCAGVASLAEKNVAVFGDIPFTEEIEGMLANEIMHFYIWNHKKEIPVTLEFDQDFERNNGAFSANGLSVVSKIKVSPTGFKDINDSYITIFPNPAKEAFYIKTNITGNSMLDIIDARGHTVLHTDYSGERKFDLRNLSPGIYYIKIYNDDGMMTKKIVME